MTQAVLTIAPQAPATEAFALMMARRIRQLPVVHEAQLVGIITLCEAGKARSSQPNNSGTPLTVEALMVREPLVVSPTCTVVDSARLMASHGISGVPVVEHNQVVGIMTKSDAFRAIVNSVLLADTVQATL